MVFRFVQNIFFGQHKSYNIIFFCRAKREFFFQNLTVGYMTKTLNQIIFFFLHQNQNIFFSNIGNQNIFLEKNHNPPFKLNGRSLRILFFFQNLTVGYMTKTLKIIFFIPPPKSEYFYSNIENQNIFLGKNHTQRVFTMGRNILLQVTS